MPIRSPEGGSEVRPVKDTSAKMENRRVVFVFILLHGVVLCYCQKFMVLARYRRNAFSKSCSPFCLVVSIFSLIPFLSSILLPFSVTNILIYWKKLEVQAVMEVCGSLFLVCLRLTQFHTYKF